MVRSGSVAARFQPNMGSVSKSGPILAGRAQPDELALMRTLKAALDPKGILNPGKVLEPTDAHAKAAE